MAILLASIVIVSTAAGPRDGVALVNLLAIVVAAVPGAIVFQLLPVNALQVAVGAVTGLGLIAVSVTRRLHAAPSVPGGWVLVIGEPLLR